MGASCRQFWGVRLLCSFAKLVFSFVFFVVGSCFWNLAVAVVAILDHLEPCRGHLEPSWSHLGALLCHFGTVLKPFWSHAQHFEAISGDLGAILAQLGASLGPFWAILSATGFVSKQREGLPEH